MKILLADDEVTILEIMRLYLQKEGFIVYVAEDGEQALQLEGKYHPDLLILDVMLPKINGFDLCRFIDRKVPKIFLTAKSEECDKIKGFSLGGDDYITKPFSPREVVARVKAVLRRSGMMENDIHCFKYGEIMLDDFHKVVEVQGEKKCLPPKEYALLHFFLKHPGQTFSREQLLTNVWNYDFDGDERAVDAVVKRLRQKIADARSLYIHTVRGFGYRFEVVDK
ncbi:MAG: response regulator transcription factor [Selenomonadaceae bacterium]